MNCWQQLLIILLGIFSFLGILRGFRESKKGNAYGLTRVFAVIGAFVWGDVVVFGFFWFLVSIIALIVNDWLLFLMTVCIFWFLRGIGEMVYWLNQQFSSDNRNPPERFWLHKIFRNDSVWFVMQIISMCVAVMAAVVFLLLFKMWI